MEKRIVVDIETKDPNLADLGPGSIRKDGKILMVGTYDGVKARTFSPKSEELKAILADPTVTKIAHNGVYDFDWLYNGYGLEINGRCEDTLTRDTLLYEYYDSYALDACCKRWGLAGKNKDDTIDTWWSEAGGKGKAVEHLDEMPYEVVENYCLQDCVATWNLYSRQAGELVSQQLEEANSLEAAQYPIILEMKKNGIAVDERKQAKIIAETKTELSEKKRELVSEYGITNVRSPIELKKVFGDLGLLEKLSKTEKGAPGFNALSLQGISHPIGEKILEIRKLTVMVEMLEDKFQKHKINGKMHPVFVPTQRDDGGTITGRYSCKTPNLQAVSSKEETRGNVVRSIFIPEEDCILGAFDFKQIEYVIFSHYAIGAGSDEVRERIRAGDDYHSIVQKMLGWEGKDGRKFTKNFNFGMLYGMGKGGFERRFVHEINKVLAKTGTSQTVTEYVNTMYNSYHTRAAYVRSTANAISQEALHRGFVRSIGGRKHRIPADTSKAYKMPNALIQGGAADMLKAALVAAWKEGVFNVLKLHLLVHDEIVFSIPRTKTGFEAAEALAVCMTDTIKLSVPLRIDAEAGADWGNCTGEFYNERKLSYLG